MSPEQILTAGPSWVALAILVALLVFAPSPTPNGWRWIGLSVAACFVALVIFGATGCATAQPRLNALVLEGRTIIEFYDAADLAYARCGPGSARMDGALISGCQWQNGANSVIAYYDAKPPEATVRHERAHALGMKHGPWTRRGPHLCADILVPGGGYTGQRICNAGALNEWTEGQP